MTKHCLFTLAACSVVATLSAGCVSSHSTISQEDRLISAVSKGDIAAVRRALNSGANPNARAGTAAERVTPLMIAVTSDRLDIAGVLLDRGAAVDLHDDDGETALTKAVEWSGKPIVKLLTDHGAEPFQLHRAAISGDANAVAQLLRRNADVNGVDRNGCTGLLVASLLGRVGVVEELLKSGADPNKCDKAGFTPVYQAATKGNARVVELLLKAGARKATKCRGYTPARSAEIYVHDDVVAILARYP